MESAGVIAHYVMDGDQPPLMADSAGNTAFYLYGLGAIGEKTTAWNYSLPDGSNTPRQLADALGDITLSSRYTPWGDTLDTYGTGNFTYGYFGGVMDAATGLLYVGNGQYYDPATGRFLTRGVNPDSTNPYTPWNPIGAIVGPLGLIALFSGRKKKGSKAGTFLVLLLVLVTVGMTLSACGGGGSGGSTPSDPNSTSNQTPVDTGSGTYAGSGVSTSTPPSASLTPCDCTQTPSQTPTPVYLAEEAAKWAEDHWNGAQIPEEYGSDCTGYVSLALHNGGNLPTDQIWKPGIDGYICTDPGENCPWIQTPDLYYYLTGTAGFVTVAEFNNSPDYSDDDSGNLNNFLYLRANPEWSNFVNNNIQRGDLVFYHDNDYADWNHVAIVTGKGNQTFYKYPETGIQEPLVHDHDGPTDLEDLPRSMGDTDNPRIKRVAVLHKP